MLKCSNTDSMPDLINVSESEVSTDSVIFVLTSPDSCRTTNSEVDDEETNPTLFSDEEMINLAEDEGEEGLTTFNAAMLVNVEGQVEGTQTKLYDSGASHHMSPYHDHFETYVPIAPKSITAADKRCFQAIGKENLQKWLQHNCRSSEGCSALPGHGINFGLNRENHCCRL